jgi:hypothetical protein
MPKKEEEETVASRHWFPMPHISRRGDKRVKMGPSHHMWTSVRPSIRPSVCPPVCPSDRPSAPPPVRPAGNMGRGGRMDECMYVYMYGRSECPYVMRSVAWRGGNKGNRFLGPRRPPGGPGKTKSCASKGGLRQLNHVLQKGPGKWYMAVTRLSPSHTPGNVIRPK